ncbi:MAG TPA: hypothetical protein VJZ24_03045, partial [Thermodesulfovibrionales bacterium]|nr:hypothetical protein [Thermodesulfovibrionales bacterium]
VNPGSEYEELINFLIEKLYDIKDPLTGTQLIKHVYRKDQIYHGPYIDWAPDLMLEWWVDNAFITKPNHSKNDDRIVNGYTDYLQKDHRKHRICRSGEHRLDGILILKGGSVQRGEISPHPEIIDIAPTILYLLGIPIPEDMDGRVIQSAFVKKFLDSTPLLYQKVDRDYDRREASEKAYSDEEEKAIKDKLRRLGYMD